MRDWPRRVISCNSFTDNSSFSSRATIRNRVGSDRARNDFRVGDIMAMGASKFLEISVDAASPRYIILS